MFTFTAIFHNFWQSLCLPSPISETTRKGNVQTSLFIIVSTFQAASSPSQSVILGGMSAERSSSISDSPRPCLVELRPLVLAV